MEGSEGRFQVLVRVRPVFEKDAAEASKTELPSRFSLKAASPAQQAVLLQGKQVILQGSDKDAERGRETFAVDRCLGPTGEGKSRAPDEATVQQELLEACGRPLVNAGLAGFDGFVVVLGQRGSGKTHTLLGSGASASGAQPPVGLLPQVLQTLLDEKPSVPVTVSLSVMEILPGEILRDLLEPCGRFAEPGSQADAQEVSLLEHPQLGVFLLGLKEVVCSSLSGLEKLLSSCKKERILSSAYPGAYGRSHLAFFLHLRRGKESPEESESQAEKLASVPEARLLFLELAPEEARWLATSRLRTVGGRLSALRCTIQGLLKEMPTKGHPALWSGTELGTGPVAPVFQASLLTQLLRKSLEGASRCAYAIATTSPTAADLEETRRTLRLASAFGRLPPGVAAPNPSAGEVRPHLRAYLKRLRHELGNSPVCLKWEALLLQHQASASVIDREAILMLETYQRQRGVSPGAEPPERLPYFTKLGSDPALSSAVVFPLEYPATEPISVGSDEECQIVLPGVGVHSRLCNISVSSGDQVKLDLFSPPTKLHHSRCLVNGKVVPRNSSVMLAHGDRVLLGWAHALRLHLPGHGPLPPLTAEEAFAEVAAESSRAYMSLKGREQDLGRHGLEVRPEDVLSVVKEVAFLVDEANEITKEVRTDLTLTFEVEFAADIHRSPAEMVLVRIQSVISTLGVYEEKPMVIAYWTVRKFLGRLSEMRACHIRFTQKKTWESTSNPLEDPWQDLALDETSIYSQMLQSVRVGSSGSASPHPAAAAGRHRASRPSSGAARIALEAARPTSSGGKESSALLGRREIGAAHGQIEALQRELASVEHKRSLQTKKLELEVLSIREAFSRQIAETELKCERLIREKDGERETWFEERKADISKVRAAAVLMQFLFQRRRSKFLVQLAAERESFEKKKSLLDEEIQRQKSLLEKTRANSKRELEQLRVGYEEQIQQLNESIVGIRQETQRVKEELAQQAGRLASLEEENATLQKEGKELRKQLAESQKREEEARQNSQVESLVLELRRTKKLLQDRRHAEADKLKKELMSYVKFIVQLLPDAQEENFASQDLANVDQFKERLASVRTGGGPTPRNDRAGAGQRTLSPPQATSQSRVALPSVPVKAAGPPRRRSGSARS